MHAIVTGGTSGIGLALVRRLTAAGARVSVLALDNGDLEALASQALEGLHLEAVDVADREAVARAVGESVAQQGACDLLVTCAGVTRPGRFTELADDEFVRQLEVNYLGTLWPVRAVVPTMIARGTGALVLVSSFAALLGVYGYGAYAPSKWAVRGLAETLRTELAPHGIHVASVFPTDVDTPMLAGEEPLKPPETAALSSNARVLTPEEVAEAILTGLAQRTSQIFCDRSSAALGRVAGAAPGLTRRIVDRTVRRVRHEAQRAAES